MTPVLVLLLLLLPSVSLAAYQDPFIETSQTLPNGLVKIDVVFNGNAGEPSIKTSYLMKPGANFNDVRRWAKDTIDDLDSVRTSAAVPGLQPGQTIQRLARVNPAKAAKQAWNEDFSLYLRIKDSGITALASVITTLKARIEANWQAGYLDE